MCVEQEDDETVAAYKLFATGETLTKQQIMQSDIAEYNYSVIQTYPQKNLVLIFLRHEKWKKGQERFAKSNWKSTYGSIKQTCRRI